MLIVVCDNFKRNNAQGRRSSIYLERDLDTIWNDIVFHYFEY